MAKKAKQQGEGDRRGNVEGSGSRGNPPHEKTEELVRQVKMCARRGLTQSDAAVICNISEDTIQRHYSDEWKSGKAVARDKHHARCFDLAMGIPKNEDDLKEGWIIEPNVTLLIWLDKVQFGRTEKSRLEVSSGGGPETNNSNASSEIARRLSRLGGDNGG